MKPLPAPHVGNVKPSRTGLVSGVGLSLAAHMAIGALIIGVSHRTETAAVPIVAIELFDSREQQAIAPSHEIALKREGTSPVDAAARPDRPPTAADPEPIAGDFSSLDAAETALPAAGSALPETPPSDPSLPIAPGFSIAPEPALSEQRSVDATRTPDKTAEPNPERLTQQSTIDPPPPPTRQPPPRKPPAPAPLPPDHPRPLEDPAVGGGSVGGQPPGQSGAEHPTAPASLSLSEMQSGNRSAHPSVSPPPRYPIAARQRGQQGRVVLRVLVTASGVPADVQLMESSGTATLDDAAKDAVGQWRFHPALRNGTAVDTRLDVPIRFRLDED